VNEIAFSIEPDGRKVSLRLSFWIKARDGCCESVLADFTLQK